MNAIEAARGKWRGILGSYGLDESYLTGKHGPCPLCGGKDRFRFLDYQGTGSWVCNQCTPKPGDGMDLLQAFTQRDDFANIAKEVEGICGVVKTDAPGRRGPDPTKRIEHVASKAKPLTGEDPASKYLDSRGIHSRSNQIRFLDNYSYFENGEVKGRYPAMVCRVSRKDMTRETFHIVYLGDGVKAGVKAPKKTLPPVSTITGCAVYLAKPEGHVLVTEGVETGLAAMDLFGLPVAATLTAGGMETWQPPESVTKAWVLADNDASFTGQAAAYRLANRLYRHIDVDVIIPPTTGSDFLDVMTEVNKQNLAHSMSKDEIWETMQSDQPDMADFVRQCQEKFGTIKLVEYEAGG